MKTVPNPDPSIRILKTATCPSLSGKSTLTYNVGCNASSEIQFCIVPNSSAGFFSKEWIPMASIGAVLDKLKGNPTGSNGLKADTHRKRAKPSEKWEADIGFRRNRSFVVQASNAEAAIQGRESTLLVGRLQCSGT